MTLLDPSPGAAGSLTSEPVVVCHVDQLEPERGVAALLDGRQVALFRLLDGTVHAIDHKDPVTGSNVMARGLLGTAAGEWYVASPLLKQRYSLTTGRCLDDPALSVDVHAVHVDDDGVVAVSLASRS